MKRKLQKKDGFTLIEVLISLVVFAIIVIPISMMVMQGVKTNKKAEEKQQAMMIAQHIMENIKGMSENELINLDSLEVRGYRISKKDRYLGGNVDGYDIKVTIMPVENYSFNNGSLELANSYCIEISNEGSDIKLFNKIDNIDRGIEENTIKIKKDKIGKVLVNNTSINNKERKPIYLVVDEACTRNINLILENESREEEKLFLIKKEGSTATFDIKNDKGLFDITTDIVIPKNNYEKNVKLYEVKITAVKNGNEFEINSYKNIK